MSKHRSRQLDFVIDRLTNSIQNTISGDSFETEVSLLRKEDIKQVIKKNGWNFNWKKELENNSKEVYKLTIINNLQVIQGLISLSRKKDHIFIELLETAPFNIGKNKLYEGVAGNLVAYACRLSFQMGFEGFVSFISKTKLISHYENSLGAYHLGGHLMVIDTGSAQLLVDKYFKTK